jgi:hypothetical protein
MVQDRIAPRYRVNKPATIDYGGDKYPCMVRDISSTGAALELSGLAQIVRRAKAFAADPGRSIKAVLPRRLAKGLSSGRCLRLSTGHVAAVKRR